MKTKTQFAVATLLAAVAFGQAGKNEKEPQFSDYSVAADFHGTPAAPRLMTRGQRMFRTMIRDWVSKGPNFAGHYTIAEWGCGAGCVSIAVVDVQSGSVHDGPFGTLPRASLSLGPDVGDDTTGLFYHLNSRLLIARGCPNNTGCGAYYYEWTGAQFRLLRRVPAKP